MHKMTLVAFLGWIACCGQVLADGLEVTEVGKSPSRRLTVNAPGAYKAVIYQETGGGISEFYDLVADPEAKRNLAGRGRGDFLVAKGALAGAGALAGGASLLPGLFLSRNRERRSVLPRLLRAHVVPSNEQRNRLGI